MRSEVVISWLRAGVRLPLGGRLFLGGGLHQRLSLQRLVMLLVQLAKRSLRKQGRHPKEGSMTQSLEVVHGQHLGRSQVVIATKLN